MIASPDESPRRPSIAGSVMTWEATIAQASQVRARVNGVTSTLAGAFDHAAEPRAASDAVVFTAWLTGDDDGDTDVATYSVTTGAIGVVGGGAGQQRFADISTTHVAFTDFSEDPSGIFDPGSDTNTANVVVVDRATGVAAPYTKPNKQAYPTLGSAGRVLFLEWPHDHPEPKLEHFTIRSFAIDAAATTDVSIADVDQSGAAFYNRPTSFAGEVRWVTTTSGSAMFGAPVTGGAATTLATSATETLHVAVTSTSGTIYAGESASAARLHALP